MKSLLKKAWAFLKKYVWYVVGGVILLVFILSFRKKGTAWAWKSLTGREWKPGKNLSPSSRLDELDAAEKRLEEEREAEHKRDVAITTDRVDEWRERVRRRREEADRDKPPSG